MSLSLHSTLYNNKNNNLYEKKQVGTLSAVVFFNLEPFHEDVGHEQHLKVTEFQVTKVQVTSDIFWHYMPGVLLISVCIYLWQLDQPTYIMCSSENEKYLYQ